MALTLAQVRFLVFAVTLTWVVWPLRRVPVVFDRVNFDVDTRQPALEPPRLVMLKRRAWPFFSLHVRVRQGLAATSLAGASRETTVGLPATPVVEPIHAAYVETRV